jgi:hypothetical protein
MSSYRKVCDSLSILQLEINLDYDYRKFCKFFVMNFQLFFGGIYVLIIGKHFQFDDDTYRLGNKIYIKFPPHFLYQNYKILHPHLC